MDIRSDEAIHSASSDMCVSLTGYLGAEYLAKILSFLWFDDHAIISLVSTALHEVVQSESLATYMLQRLLEYLNQPLRSPRISFNAEVRLALRRISSWPTAVDAAALNHSQGPRNVNIVLSDHLQGNDSRVVYREKRKENRSKAYAVAISDDHFPCLPGASTYRFKNEINQGWIRPVRDGNPNNKAETQKIIIRSMTPFTKVVQINEIEQVVTLSCVGYFESQVHPKDSTFSNKDNINDDNDSHQLYQLQLSIGLACALFPLRGRRAGFDKNSFGYHGDGRIYHGSRNCVKVGPSYDIGDTVGCGVLYPPLGKQHGQLFYTKNGVLVAVMDIGVGGLLCLPWFPVVGLAPSIPTEFNFGIHRSFAFDVIAFEEQQLIEAFGVRSSSSTVNPRIHSNNGSSSMNNNNGNNNNGNSNFSNGSSISSSPSNVPGHSDPWRYYETLAAEQEAKQYVPRHPKYRNSRWDMSNRSNEVPVLPVKSMQIVKSVTMNEIIPAVSSSSASASSVSVAVRNSFILPHSSSMFPSNTCDDSKMSVNQVDSSNSADAITYPSRERSNSTLSTSTRTGRGGRERGRGGDFLLAKRQYAYISRSAKLERLTTIISATNAPYVSPIRRGATGTSSLVIPHNEKQNDMVDEKKVVCVSREKTVLEKGKRKRKSLFLNPDLRAATLSEISNTSRPAMGGSDASCEDEDEEDSEEEEDDEEELASTCGQDADSHDEWGFRGFRANRPLIPPRVMIRAPTSYSAAGPDDDDDLGSMAVEPSSEDEEEDDVPLDVPFTVAPRPSSSPLAMRPPSLPEGVSRMRKPKIMTYHAHYDKFESVSYQGQSQDVLVGRPKEEEVDLEGQDTSMGVFVALADVAHGSGPDWLRRGCVAGAFGSRVDRAIDSDDSVATSLFVEVASVDECGSYIGYGGAGDSEEEDDEVASERGSRNGTLTHSLSGRPVGWGVETADADADLESLSVEDKFGGLTGTRKRKGFPGGSRDFRPYIHSNSSSNMRVMWDPDGDGYDGASERGRCETDGFEDFNTDGDVEFEEIEEREDHYSNSSGSGYDGSVDADGGASDTYATERNTILRYTLLPPPSVPRGGSPSMHSQDSSISGGGKGRLRSSAGPHPQGQKGHTSHTSHLTGTNNSTSNGGAKRSKRRKTHQHSLHRKDSGSKENTDDQQHLHQR